MRRWVTAVVLYRRSAVLSASRHSTSSRQSPNISATNAGVALVPLFDAHWAHDTKVLPPYFVIVVLSSSSRVSSPSHQIKKLVEAGPLPICLPLAASIKPGPPEAQT